MTVTRVLVVGIALIACKGQDGKPASGGSGTEAPAAPAKVQAPSAPQLVDAAVAPALPSAPPAESTFAAQARDEDWAPGVESEIKRRFAKIRGGKLEGTECRQSQCRLTIAGSQADIGQAIADLEGHRGLHGYAANLLLTAPEKRADGTLVLRAFATFDR